MGWDEQLARFPPVQLLPLPLPTRCGSTFKPNPNPNSNPNRRYIAERLSRGGKAWQQVTVILSDASEPGEGEHKIMAYIRQQRTSLGYNPNLR